METGVIVVENLSYKDLTELYRHVKQKIKNVDEEFMELVKNKEPKDIPHKAILLLEDHMKLNKLRLQITERILDFTETIILEELWKQS
jgi:hypothetical protein